MVNLHYYENHPDMQFFMKMVYPVDSFLALHYKLLHNPNLSNREGYYLLELAIDNILPVVIEYLGKMGASLFVHRSGTSDRYDTLYYKLIFRSNFPDHIRYFRLPENWKGISIAEFIQSNEERLYETKKQQNILDVFFSLGMDINHNEVNDNKKLMTLIINIFFRNAVQDSVTHLNICKEWAEYFQAKGYDFHFKEKELMSHWGIDLLQIKLQEEDQYCIV